MPDLRKALDGVSHAEPTVLLRHHPNGFAESQKLDVDFQLRGTLMLVRRGRENVRY